MSGYALADVTWSDEQGRKDYVALLGPSLAAHGGEVVAASRDVDVMEGEWQPGEMTVLVSFPSRAAAMGWYVSEEYRAALEIRRRSSSSRFMIFGH